MGLFKDSLKLVNELVTLGGAGRLEKAKLAYEDAYSRFQLLQDEVNDYKKRINNAVEAIGRALTYAKPYLESGERLIKCRVKVRYDLDVAVTTQTLHKIEKFNAGMNSAISVGVGSVAGGTMAVGAWSLVTLFGSASTGTAISSLSGIAATNATLAWFGGGALTAGGAGMAGGMTVLGGIFAIPLVYVAAKSTHTKAKELEVEKTKIEESIVEIMKQLEALPSILQLVEARRRETEQLCNDFIAKIVGIKKVIEPLGLISVIKQKILSLIGKQPYSKAQLDAMIELNKILTTFIAAFDVPASSAKSGVRDTSQ